MSKPSKKERNEVYLAVQEFVDDPLISKHVANVDFIVDYILEGKKDGFTAKVNNMIMNRDLLERVARLEHAQWSEWLIHTLRNLSLKNQLNWERQSGESYDELTEKEKESDRKFAMLVINAVYGWLVDGKTMKTTKNENVELKEEIKKLNFDNNVLKIGFIIVNNKLNLAREELEAISEGSVFHVFARNILKLLNPCDFKEVKNGE